MCDNSCIAHSNPNCLQQAEKIANFLRTRVDIKPRIGIICGTGLVGVPTLLTNPATVPYESIPDFPVTTVPGHEGKLTFGYLGPTPVVVMEGRFHLYEGYPLWKVVLPIRVMKLLGISILVLSNAAGGINNAYSVGDIMFIKDHINLVSFGGHNPLQGPLLGGFGRFVPMTDAYDAKILKVARETAKELRMRGMVEGVYACVGGPSFETVAELKALKVLGADAVGLSTVHEVIAARQCGLKCFAFSLITNKCALDYSGKYQPDHDENLNVGKTRQGDVLRFIDRLFANLIQGNV